MRVLALDGVSHLNFMSAAVLPMNWARYAACRSEPHPLAATMCTPTETSSSLRATLESPSEEDRIRRLDDFMKTLVPRFELDAAVTSLGVTSLGATALAASLSEALSLKLPPTLAYECVSLRGIRDHVLSKLFPSWRYKGRYHLNRLQRVVTDHGHIPLRTAAGDAQELWTALIAGRDCVSGVRRTGRTPEDREPTWMLLPSRPSMLSFWDVEGRGGSHGPAATIISRVLRGKGLETAGYRATPATTSETGLQIGVFCAIETSDYAVLATE